MKTLKKNCKSLSLHSAAIMRLLIFSVVLFLSAEISSQTASGIVFRDSNQNGKRDQGEKGIANVGVSNGVAVVLTDGKGRYTIDAPDQSVIFIIKPADYRSPVNEMNLPLFYYKHFPQGSPPMKYAGIHPTGSLPGSIDFPLIPEDKVDVFRVVIFGDTQVRNLDEIEYLGNDIVAELAGSSSFVFGSVLGDLVFDDLSLYKPLNQLMSALKVPMYNVPGNHDENYEAASDHTANETFQDTYGPKTYSFNYGEVHFIVLDNIIYSGDSVKKSYEEGFGEDVIQYVKNDLKYVPSGKLIVLMMHAPFLNSGTGEPIRNLDQILAELSAFPHSFSISGHDHAISQQLITGKYGWKRESPHHHFCTGAACGNWWQGALDISGLPDATMHDGSPNGYSLVNFSGNTYTVDYQVARKPVDYTMAIYTTVLPSENPEKVIPGEVIVNFFTGSEKDEIRVRFDDGEWKKMSHEFIPDPGFVRQRKLWEDPAVKMEGKMPSRPGNSKHIWKANIPGDLNQGLHKIEVEATDLFGRSHRAFHYFNAGY